MFTYKHAAVMIQKHFRGMKARNLVTKVKLSILREFSATQIQKIQRGRIGRVRMRNYRLLCSSRTRLVELSNMVEHFDFQKLGKWCLDTRQPTSLDHPSYVFLGLIRVLMKMCSSCEGIDCVVNNVQWIEAGKYMNRSNKLLRLFQIISVNAGKKRLPISQGAVDLLQAYKIDSQFCLSNFKSFEALSHVACTIYEWVHAIANVAVVQDIFLTSSKILVLSPEEHFEVDHAEDIKVLIDMTQRYIITYYNICL